MAVTDWLDELGPSTVTPAGIDAIRERLDHHAREVSADLDPTLGPLRAPKGRLSAVMRCERSVLAQLEHGPERGNELTALGQLVDRLVAVFIHGGLEDPAGRSVRDHLLADPDPDLLEQCDAAGLLDRLDAPAAAVRAAFGPTERGTSIAAWWPRTQSTATVSLADGRVVVAGRFDLELGGPASGRPVVIVEVKSGRPGSPDHRHDAYLYALLASLRDGVAPAGVATWYAEGGFAPVPVTDHVLEAAAARLAEGLTRLGRLAAGEPAHEHAGPWCRWCPDQGVCPTARHEVEGPSDEPGTDELDDWW